MAENNQEQIPETSYSKGENFEKLFAEYMKSDLGWDKYVIRAQQKGKANGKGSQVDIIAEKKDDRGKRLYNTGFILFLVFIFIASISIIANINKDIGDSDLVGLMLLSFVFAGGAIYCIHNSSKYHKENAWVECKNRKLKTPYEDIVKSITEFKDYKASGDTEYKYVAHYFVSANGFVENALKFAIDNEIICYEYKNGKFEKVNYWK